jgi:hypothetical protein
MGSSIFALRYLLLHRHGKTGTREFTEELFEHITECCLWSGIQGTGYGVEWQVVGSFGQLQHIVDGVAVFVGGWMGVVDMSRFVSVFGIWRGGKGSHDSCVVVFWSFWIGEEWNGVGRFEDKWALLYLRLAEQMTYISIVQNTRGPAAHDYPCLMFQDFENSRLISWSCSSSSSAATCLFSRLVL